MHRYWKNFTFYVFFAIYIRFLCSPLLCQSYFTPIASQQKTGYTIRITPIGSFFFQKSKAVLKPAIY